MPRDSTLRGALGIRSSPSLEQEMVDRLTRRREGSHQIPVADDIARSARRKHRPEGTVSHGRSIDARRLPEGAEVFLPRAQVPLQRRSQPVVTLLELGRARAFPVDPHQAFFERIPGHGERRQLRVVDVVQQAAGHGIHGG